MLFIPTLGGIGSLFPLAALLAGITILILLGGWSAQEPVQQRPGMTIRVPTVVFWLTAVPMTVGIVFLALILLLPVLFAVLASGFWLGAVGI